MNATPPTLEQMINMKLDERTNENKQMDNILSNIQKHNNYNKQDIEDLQDEELQMYKMQMPMQNMNMPMQNMNMPMQNMGMPMQNMGMQNMGMQMPMQNMNMPMQNMNMPMQNMGMPMQNMNMPMQNMGKKNDIYGMEETNDVDNLKTKKIISYIKDPLIIFIIFVLLNSSIVIQTIDNLLAFCNNASLVNIINLIIRGLIASLIYIIITNILTNI
jgi:hypothetical protein